MNWLISSNGRSFVTRGEELEVPISTLPNSSDAVVGVSSASTFRQAESSVIVEALRAAAGRIAGKGEPPNGSD